MLVAVWPRTNDAGRIKWVSRRRVRLVLGWVTVYGHTVLACNLPSRPTHPSTLSRMDKNSSGDEIANVNFLRQHRTCRGQRLRPFNEFVISTKRLRQKRYTLPTCLEMDSPVQSASHNKRTRPSVKETHQATWA